MKPAVIVVDMVNDNVHGKEHWPITDAARAIVPGINRLLDRAHARGWPVVFACDSFLPDDFIFGGRLKPHSLRGTRGAEPIPQLHRQPEDHVLPKRRFSAFFKTDLDQTLRTAGVDTALVCGCNWPFAFLLAATGQIKTSVASCVAIISFDCSSG